MLLIKILALIVHEFIKEYRNLDEKSVDIVDESVHSFATSDPVTKPAGPTAGSDIGFNTKVRE
jgi:hypothetical protein